jgi:dihydrodipicolinate synthase/N-acetylneuraminate lyase
MLVWCRRRPTPHFVIEHVVAIKWNPAPGVAYEDIYRHAKVFNIIDNSGQPVLSHKLGGQGFINMTAEVYPRHDLHVWELIEAGRYDEAQAEWDKVSIPLTDWYAKIDARSGGQARAKKGLMDAMGRSFGPSRPPTLPLSREEVEEARQILGGIERLDVAVEAAGEDASNGALRRL